MTTIGLLETGFPPEPLRERHGASYGGMIRTLLGEGFVYRFYDVPRGELPDAPEDCHAYVVTGSSAGVYDDLPWIAPLTRFLQAAKGRAKLVGICFGHQIMAQAFGGRVVKSEKGWGLGLHDYAITERLPWMSGDTAIAVAVSHQDQVVEPPPGARTVGGSAFTPHGVLAYADQPALSFQCHPEFEADFAGALVERRRQTFADEADMQACLATLSRPSDRTRVGTWIRDFLNQPD